MNKIEETHSFTDEALRLWGVGEKFVWTIESKENSSFIGRIEAKKAPELPGKVWGLGYWIHPLHQQKGYATEAGKEVIRFIFEELKGFSYDEVAEEEGEGSDSQASGEELAHGGDE